VLLTKRVAKFQCATRTWSSHIVGYIILIHYAKFKLFFYYQPSHPMTMTMKIIIIICSQYWGLSVTDFEWQISCY